MLIISILLVVLYIGAAIRRPRGLLENYRVYTADEFQKTFKKEAEL